MKSKVPDNTLFYPSQLAAEQLLHATSLAGTDQDGNKIADALRKMIPESRYLGKGGWPGQAQYGINQQLASPVGMGIIVNGKQEDQRRISVAAKPSKPWACARLRSRAAVHLLSAPLHRISDTEAVPVLSRLLGVLTI
jgi:branched-chain amino acid transport system substrate-binding protein